MTSRHDDGSAGDANYGRIGDGYAQYRRPDARIAAMIGRALANARTVLNVGAGADSYEPVDRRVTAVEPSASMRAQRPPSLPVAIDAVAEHLPFEDNSFDASMATFTVHQWPNLKAGLAEMRRVTRDLLLILTCDPDELDRFWLHHYAPGSHFRRSAPIPAYGNDQRGVGWPHRDDPRSDSAGLYRRLRGGLLRAAGRLARPRRPASLLGLEFRGATGGGAICGAPPARSRQRKMGCGLRPPARADVFRGLAEAHRQANGSNVIRRPMFSPETCSRFVGRRAQSECQPNVNAWAWTPGSRMRISNV